MAEMCPVYGVMCIRELNCLVSNYAVILRRPPRGGVKNRDRTSPPPNVSDEVFYGEN